MAYGFGFGVEPLINRVAFCIIIAQPSAEGRGHAVTIAAVLRTSS